MAVLAVRLGALLGRAGSCTTPTTAVLATSYYFHVFDVYAQPGATQMVDC